MEIQTKVASVVPFFLGSLYAIYRFESFSFKNFMLMFISLICIDMATTGINNYIDYKKAIITEGFNYESHNAIVRDKLKEVNVVVTILSLIAIAAVFGVLLFLNTDYVVLLLGMLSFAIGVLYSFGPVPISRTPLGEIFSGFTMGFIILFLSVYIHVFTGDLVGLHFAEGIFAISLNVKEILFIFLISITTISGIANIMLANNLCDIEDDRENRRYTLPIYIGRENGLKLFKWLYYISYIDIVILILLGVEPITAALVLLTFIPLRNNIRVFYNEQSKEKTFILAVKNFLLLNGSHIVALAVGISIRAIF